MKISIASYSFNGLSGAGMMDVFGYLESCKHRYGLDAADIWNGILGSDEKAYLQPDFLRKVREALSERELALVNYHADGCHICEDDPAARERNYQSALAHLKAAAHLGALTIRNHRKQRNTYLVHRYMVGIGLFRALNLQVLCSLR